MNYERKTYYEDDDIRVYLENINDQVFIHVGINKSSKAVFKRIKSKWEEVAIKMFAIGYEDLFSYTTDNRIIKMIGGAKNIGSGMVSGKTYEVWKWDLN